MWWLKPLLIILSSQAQISEADCQCEHIPTIVADEQKYASYRHHQVALPTKTELHNLTSNVKDILAQANCHPTEFEAGKWGIGTEETLFACPAGFAPCPILPDPTHEVLQACNNEKFVIPLPFIIHHGEIFKVDEVQNIQPTSQDMASRVLEVNKWPVLGMSTSFHFVYKFGKSVWMDPPLKAKILCRLPKALFDEQLGLQEAHQRLMRGVKNYNQLLKGQVVNTKIHYPNTVISKTRTR